MSRYERLLEKNLVPEAAIRIYVRQALRRHERRDRRQTVEARQEALMRIVAELRRQPIAVHPHLPKAQHYELPTDFFKTVLGSRLKYSCGWWSNPHSLHNLPAGLDRSEEAMLELTCKRAEISDGQSILDLGCGWGSFSLYVARTYPRCRILAVSNSATQKAYLEEQAQAHALGNVRVQKADVNHLLLHEQFDRIVSVEMFEHIRNYSALLSKLSALLTPGGKLFVHLFTCRGTPYFFRFEDERDWMARNFFAGGIMPGEDLLLYFADDFAAERVWRVSGMHYRNTLEAWLCNMKHNRKKIMAVLTDFYGPGGMRKWWAYWKTFFIVCSELFGYAGGNAWFVSHYLLEKKGRSGQS